MSGPKPAPCLMRLTTLLAVCFAATIARPTAADVTDMLLIDQGVADYNPLTTSLRVIEPGLYQSSDFSQVVRHGDAYMRSQGGLHAVFTQSTYSKSKQSKGITPTVPPGTVFYIGQPPAEQPRSDDAAFERDLALVGGGTISPRIDTRVVPGSLPMPVHPNQRETGPKSDALRPESHNRLPRRDVGLGPHGIDDAATWLPGPEPARGFADPVERAARMKALLGELARRGGST